MPPRSNAATSRTCRLSSSSSSSSSRRSAYGCIILGEPLDRDHVDDEQRDGDAAAAVKHPRGEPVEVWTAFFAERDELAVALDAGG